MAYRVTVFYLMCMASILQVDVEYVSGARELHPRITGISSNNLAYTHNGQLTAIYTEHVQKTIIEVPYM